MGQSPKNPAIFCWDEALQMWYDAYDKHRLFRKGAANMDKKIRFGIIGYGVQGAYNAELNRRIAAEGKFPIRD